MNEVGSAAESLKEELNQKNVQLKKYIDTYVSTKYTYLLFKNMSNIIDRQPVYYIGHIFS